MADDAWKVYKSLTKRSTQLRVLTESKMWCRWEDFSNLDIDRQSPIFFILLRTLNLKLLQILYILSFLEAISPLWSQHIIYGHKYNTPSIKDWTWALHFVWTKVSFNYLLKLLPMLTILVPVFNKLIACLARLRY